MRFRATALPGVWHIEAEPHADARGLFSRLYCPNEFAEAGLGDFHPTQVNLSRNPTCHTLRGLHFQPSPHSEAKLVRAVRGRAYDVVLDLRTESPQCGRWVVVQLDAIGMNAVFIPEGCAHGFLTLQPDTDILYQMSRCHVPDQARGVRWDDPAIGIAWPARPMLIDDRDAHWPDWPHPRAA